MSRSVIRSEVKRALGGRSADVYLFGSYARGEATRESDVDLLFVLHYPCDDWFKEGADMRRLMTTSKSIDVVVMDDATYEAWKDVEQSLQYDVARQGVRLV